LPSSALCRQPQTRHAPRHCSMNSFMLNLLAGLVAYGLKKYKLSLCLTDVERNSLVIA
jgi:hypothetical protein